MISNRANRPIRLMFVLMALILPAQAQFHSGIEGSVKDPSGALVPDVTITVHNSNTGEERTVKTSTAGYFRIEPLPAGKFSIKASQTGFKSFEQSDISVEADQVRTVNIALQLGEAGITVQVSAEAPPVETSEGRVSGLIEESKVRELPITGRNIYGLVVLTPGVTGLPAGGGQSYAQATGDIFTTEYGVSLSANGQRSAGNNFTVDGASTNNVAHGGVTNFSPNAESVQEVRILANSFSAEYGRNSSVVVNVLTKQGSNEFHGSMSWFHTNNHLNARSIFQNQVPVFRRNEGSASFGGPIRKNQTFFFGSVDFLRSGVASAQVVNVETPEFTNFMKQTHPNNISTLLLTKYPTLVNPVSNFQTAGSLLNTNCGSLPTSSALIQSQLGLIPCNLRVRGETTFNSTIPRNGLQWSGRVDHNFNDSKDRLYGNVYRTTVDTTLFSNSYPRPDFTRPWHEYTHYANVNETHIFSPNVINEMGASWTRAFGSTTCEPCEIPGINIVGLQGFGLPGWEPGTFVQNIYEWRDVLSFNKGSHSLKIGGNIQHNQDYDNFGLFLLRPIFSFNSVLDFAADKVFQEAGFGIDPKTGGRASSAQGYVASRDGNIGLFVQDDWKVRPNLTLNLGLRWEDFGNPRHRHDSTENVIFQGGDTYSTRLANAKVDYTPNHRVFNGADLNNFAPRIAFAWDPTKQGRMSVRGGTGVFYNRVADGIYNGVQNDPPRIATVTANTLTPGVTPIYSLGTPTEPWGFSPPAGIVPGLDSKNGLLAGRANITGADLNLRTSYSYNWFFGIQYGFGNNWMIQGNYIGSSAHKLYGNYDVNRVNNDLIINNGQLLRLNRSFGPITYGSNLFNSFYSGGTFALKKRFSSGFSIDSAYTIGRAVDGGFVGGGGNEINTMIADVNNLRRERALAVFDIPQRWSLSLLYQIPMPRLNNAVKAILGGWQLSNVTIYQKGTPFSVYCTLPFSAVRNSSGTIVGNSGCDYNADGSNYDYPNAPSFKDPTQNATRQNYLDGLFKASDFSAPAFGQEGNIGRDVYRNPSYFNTDLSLAKQARIPWFLGDNGATLQFRAEFYNAFNKVNLGSVSQDMADPLFGRVTSAFPGRNVQFGLRLAF